MGEHADAHRSRHPASIRDRRVQALGLFMTGAIAEVPGTATRARDTAIWTVPEIGALPRNAHGLQVRKGRDLITATYAYIGPDVSDASNRYAGNNLACSNCHLQAGTKKFGLPLFGLYSDFPSTAPALAARSASKIASIPACDEV